ncbi:MAG: KH domain-containing protein [Deltaproteobacteria bacterium]|nr:KH domain-containing protein [Deltaproteobacteria bacterium]
MSHFIDFEANSVDDAVQKACDSLNKTRSELKYDIISHGSSGIFGLVGVKKALIRVLVSQIPKLTPTDVGEPEADNGNLDFCSEEASLDVIALVDEALGQAPDPESTEEDLIVDQEPVEVDYDEVCAWVQPLIERVIQLISPDSVISVGCGGNASSPPCFVIEGGDSARLIGKRGQNLDALQYIIDKGIAKKFGSKIRVDVDIEGYIEKRKGDLKALASSLAKKAQRTGKTMVINRISAQERRVVHLTLKNNKGIRTHSVGEGELRKLLIIPKKKSVPKKQKEKKGNGS